MNLAAGDRIHMVGAGGSGMAALAALLLDRGLLVSGSDLSGGGGVRRLARRGAQVLVGSHRKENLPEGVDLVIHSAAVAEGNPELAAARLRGIEVLRYSVALGRLMGECHAVAIAGTHGKTTTSALIVHALCELGADPSYVLGAVVPSQGRAGASGSGETFIAEACEYAESFLDLTFNSATICNIEPDHLDTYRDPQTMRDAYRRFASKLPEGGRLLLTPAARDALGRGLPGHFRITTVGLAKEAEIRAADLRVSDGRCSFRIDGELKSDRLVCPVPGKHFAEDLLLAAATLSGLGVAPDDLGRVLSTYINPSRRLETVFAGKIGLISDYAHHPTELRGVCETLRQVHPGRRLLAVFQPHQASRTRFFLNEFARALACFDLTLVCDIFCTRDSPEDQASVSSEDLVLQIGAEGGRGLYAGPLDRTLRMLLGEVRAGDLILLLGAGDIDELRDDIETALSNKI